MNDAETRGLIWVLGKLRGGSINVPCPEGHHQEISFRVNETKRYLTPSFNGNRLKLQLEIEEESSIKEIGCPEMDASKPEIIAKLQELESRTIERRITNAVRRAQEAKADVVQFGNAFYHKDPKKWKGYVTQWPELLAKVDFNVHVTSYIRHIGMSGKPVNLK
jgi:spore germination protein KC